MEEGLGRGDAKGCNKKKTRMTVPRSIRFYGRVTARLPRALSASSRLPTRTTTMDIDDLLQEFDDNSVPAGTRDINDLTQAWIAERTAPEILPFQNDLLERLMDRVRQQV